VSYSRPTAHVYLRNCVSIGLFYRLVAVKKKPILHFLPFFGLRHLVMSPIVINLRKLSTGAQLQTFPYPTASKSFLYSNDFMAKSFPQTLTFKSVTDKQPDEQTDKTRRPASADRTARRQLQATGQPVSRMQATTISR